MELEKSLELEVLEIIRSHKNEILQDGDWWYGIDNHDVNVFQEWEGEFRATVYRVDITGSTDYSCWYVIPSVKLNEILFFKGDKNGNN